MVRSMLAHRAKVDEGCHRLARGSPSRGPRASAATPPMQMPAHSWLRHDHVNVLVRAAASGLPYARAAELVCKRRPKELRCQRDQVRVTTPTGSRPQRSSCWPQRRGALADLDTLSTASRVALRDGRFVYDRGSEATLQLNQPPGRLSVPHLQPSPVYLAACRRSGRGRTRVLTCGGGSLIGRNSIEARPRP